MSNSFWMAGLSVFQCLQGQRFPSPSFIFYSVWQTRPGWRGDHEEQGRGKGKRLGVGDL